MDNIKAALKSGPGSIGESTKVLANSYLTFSENHSIENRRNAFETMFVFRKTMNRDFPRDGDILLDTDFEKLYSLLCLNNNLPYKLEFDLPSFIFLILFFESKEYRTELGELDLDDRNIIYSVIYGVCMEIAPQAVLSKQNNFLDFAEIFILYFDKEINISKIKSEISLIDLITLPWNLMYYEKKPNLKEYLSNLSKSNIRYETKSIGKSIVDYKIIDVIQYADLDGELLQANLEITLMAIDDKIATLYFKDFGGNTFVERIYQLLKSHKDYEERVAETGVVGLYNQSKKLWVVLSEPKYDRVFGMSIRSLYTSFEKRKIEIERVNEIFGLFIVKKISYLGTKETIFPFICEIVTFCGIGMDEEGKKELDIKVDRYFWPDREIEIFDKTANIIKTEIWKSDSQFATIKQGEFVHGAIYKFKTTPFINYHIEDDIQTEEFTCLVFEGEDPMKIAERTLHYYNAYPIEGELIPF